MKTFLALLFIILPIIGIADAGYITYEEITGGVVQCGAGFDCGTVLDSPYAKVGPVPLAALGLVFYTTFLVFGILHLLEFDLKKVLGKFKISWSQVFLVLGGIGFTFSLYLLFLMGVILEAWCKFCLISAGSCILLFVTAVLNYLANPQPVQAPTND